MVETGDMRAQAQTELPASSVNSQDTPKHIGEIQSDVDSGLDQVSPVEIQDDGFEAVARLSPSSSEDGSASIQG